MKSMQTETRTTALYYVQWYDATRRGGQWVTLTDDLNSGGYEAVEAARREGVAECFPDSPVAKRPPYRIVQRVTIETVIPN